jgi:predicted  nucleic acid-binding Zn ribbon protein
MTGWRVDQRVTRKNGDEFGTVTEVGRDGTVKVNWDSGRTSYYDPYRSANVRSASYEESRSCPKMESTGLYRTRFSRPLT